MQHGVRGNRGHSVQKTAEPALQKEFVNASAASSEHQDVSVAALKYVKDFDLNRNIYHSF